MVNYTVAVGSGLNDWATAITGMHPGYRTRFRRRDPPAIMRGLKASLEERNGHFD
jgi:hypothetical protein